MSAASRCGAIISGAVPSGKSSMLHALAYVCCTARLEHNVEQATVAASLGVAQRTVRRFERAQTWPRDPERMVAAYADELNIDPRDLWDAALERWRTG